MPVRMCAVCRGRFEKAELFRIIMSRSGEILLDRAQKAQARGLYICRECMPHAAGKKVLERGYKRRIDPGVYERLAAEAESDE
ncbi:MAG TPA: YlxR family protein [Candidatus Monoglobus merdigallinarum]|uniref:YlxR family protein n=1 Tax=Candidatus Monoglobus merdigallinarum TaxID=2838698 RepID=A0A9D1TLM4_9FIRM|nr:YlxR family protein [Candidatus Monoglobus merdigallinarum]